MNETALVVVVPEVRRPAQARGDTGRKHALPESMQAELAFACIAHRRIITVRLSPPLLAVLIIRARFVRHDFRRGHAVKIAEIRRPGAVWAGFQAISTADTDVVVDDNGAINLLNLRKLFRNAS